MTILVYSYLILAVLAEIKDVNCIDIKGVYKTNNNVWFVAGQSLNMSCIATDINTSCTSFKWIFFNNVFEPHISQITPRMLTHTSPNDSMLKSTVTLLNATEFSKGAWYIKCSLVNTTIACSPNVADGTSFEARTSIWPLHNEHIPRVKVYSNNVSVDYGEDVNLTCTANIARYLDTMEINITVAWLSKDGESVKEMITSDTLDNFPFTLFLRNVRGTSAGRYVCKIHVHNNLDSQNFEDYESVFLTVNPKLLGSEKKMYYVKPGQAFQIFCQINGDPSSLNIKWQMKTVHGIFTDISAKENITITNEGRTLNIGTFSQDEIMFICKVKNKVGDDIVQEFTLIAGTEPTLTGPEEKKVKVDPDDDVTLTCDIDVLPLNVTWTVRGTVIKANDSSYQISTKDPRLLLIKDVDFDGSRSFICSAKNAMNVKGVQQKITVHVRVNPKLLGSEKKMYYVKPGQAFQIFCQINGDPSSLNIKWQMKTVHGIFTDISAKENITITNEGRTLNIGTFSQDEIMFICKVKNKVGDDIVQEFTLIAGTEPTLTGPEEKEVKVEPDDDVTLTCDIDVLPLNITWTVHGTVIKANDSSYQISTKDPRLLLIKDVDFDGSRSFICSAKNAMNVKGVQQKITVHVRDSLSALWPVLGVIIVAILVAASIGVSCFIKRRKQQEIERREAREIKEMNLTPSGAYGDQEDGFGDEPQRSLTA